MMDQGNRRGTPISEPELRALLLEYRKQNWRGIQLPETQRTIVEETIRGDALGPLRVVEQYVPVSASSRILDLGSGVGSFVVACRQRGLQAFGLEPDKIGAGGARITSIEIARQRIAVPCFVNGLGEQLPFHDECFDVIVMNQVIEHVADQGEVLREASRILRVGGALYIACPNYLRFYEPHYKIRWFPLLPKRLGRLYLRLRGRSSAMLDQITYTTNARLKELLSRLGPEFEIFDVHREQFLRKRTARAFLARSTRLVASLSRLPVVGSTFLWLVLRYWAIAEGGCEMLVLRKPKAHPA
jgi:SAM-dependent methyltransferase